MAKEKTEYSKREAVIMNEPDYSTQDDNSITLTGREKNTKSKEQLKVGDKVKLKREATVYNSLNKFPAECYKKEYYITDIRGDRAIISDHKQTGTSGSIAGAVNIEGLVKA